MTDARRRAVVSAPPPNTTYRLYYYANGQPIAMRVLPPNDATGTLYYLHQDHLGSTSLVTCGNSACGTVGSVVARQWYDPYGAVRASTGALPTKRTYTGQLADETGLYFYNARYYAPLIGRFISADTIVPEPGNPQALNRYSYVYNSPLRYTDPSGHDPCTGRSGTYMPDCGVDGWGMKPPRQPKAPKKTPWKQYAGDPPYSKGYDPISDSIPDWGIDQSEEWRQRRAGHVLNWACAGLWWEGGCPTPKGLAAWLLMEEFGLLYNYDFAKHNNQINRGSIAMAKRIIIGALAYWFGDGSITTQELSKYTAWFNPDRGSFAQGDVNALMTPPPDYAKKDVDKYWNQDPLTVDGHVVDVWWDSTETWCAGCVPVLTLYGVGKDTKKYYFGYRP